MTVLPVAMRSTQPVASGRTITPVGALLPPLPVALLPPVPVPLLPPAPVLCFDGLDAQPVAAARPIHAARNKMLEFCFMTGLANASGGRGRVGDLRRTGLPLPPGDCGNARDEPPGRTFAYYLRAKSFRQ